MRALILALLLPAVVHAAPAVDAEFRTRNPQPWTTVAVGPGGQINHVVSTDPALAIRSLDKDGHYQWNELALERVRALLRRNADLFGIDAADADRVGIDTGSAGYYDNATGFLLVAIKLEPAAAGLDLVIAQPRIRITPKVTREQVAARFVGHTYAARTTQVMQPQRDCGMGGLRDKAQCTARTMVQTNRLTLADGDVEVVQGNIRVAGVQRLVHCVDLGQTSRRHPDPDQATLQLRPSDGGPTVPFLLDAVTNKRLPVNATTCDEIWLRFVK